MLTLMDDISCSVPLGRLESFSSLDGGCDSRETRVDSVEPCLLGSDAWEVPCCRADNWGMLSVFLWDICGGAMSPWKLSGTTPPRSTSIGCIWHYKTIHKWISIWKLLIRVIMLAKCVLSILELRTVPTNERYFFPGVWLCRKCRS